MATDVLPESERQAQTRPAHPHNDQGGSSRGRWRWRVLAVIGVVVIVVSVVAFLPRARSSREIGPKLTHTVRRGNLRVTIVEEGLLESSEDTEIKCKVRGRNTVTWVIESGTCVKKGDVLLRLDTLYLEEQINERTKYAHWSRSAAERSKADVATAKLRISEYEEGRYVAQLAELEKQLAVAESNLRSDQSMLEHVEDMFEDGYRSELDVEATEFAVTRAVTNLDIIKTQIKVLKEFTRAETLEELKGNLAADEARHKANVERAFADASRRKRALDEYEHLVVEAERSGLVIHPSAARWENAPKIEEGVRVYKDQVLLLMPDLSKMQVKVGIRESMVDRVKPGLPAKVKLTNRTLDGEVDTVASVTRPSGWWTGNIVKYDTTIKLPSVENLKPGMSAEVELLVARHEDELMIPVAAVVESELGDFCWVKTAEGTKPRKLLIGDTNGVFTVVESGLKEGDEVVLNPLAFQQARSMMLEKLDKTAAKKRGPDAKQEPTP